MKKISLLIGSGFSVPAGYPTTTQINDRLHKIDASEICVHTSREAWFLNGKSDPNAFWMGVEERQFVQEFLEFYNSKVLRTGEKFHYETFYDYYISAYRTQSYSDDLAKFLDGFRVRNKVISDAHHVLMEFNDTFSQLLAELLKKPIEHVHKCKPYDPKYNDFLLMLEDIAKNHTVQIHTLNHDVFFEQFALTDTIQGRMDDGFEDLGSNFYAKSYSEYATYMVRLRRFVNKYEQPFCLYKLHGSIDNFWASFGDQSALVKIPPGLSAYEIHMEFSKNGKIEYAHRRSDVLPEFLSGTTHKIERYQHGDYYPVLLRHFSDNLAESTSLIVVGYGFADSRINSYIEECFLQDPRKALFIIDIKKPSIAYFERPNVYFLGTGVSIIDRTFILNNLANYEGAVA